MPKNRFQIGDLIKRVSLIVDDAPDIYYIVYDYSIDDFDWVWYSCYSLATGDSHDFLLRDDKSKKYEFVA